MVNCVLCQEDLRSRKASLFEGKARNCTASKSRAQGVLSILTPCLTFSRQEKVDWIL